MTSMMRIFILILVLSTPILAQKFSVELSVSGEMEAETRSYVARELRSLGDVSVDAKGIFTLHLIVLKNEAKNGAHTGYAVSASITELKLCERNVYRTFLTGFLYLGGKDDLRKIAQDVVTDLDRTVLEKRR